MAGTVLVVQHEANCGPGHVAAWAREAGVDLRVLHPYAGEQVPAAPPADVTGLVVLGGDMGAYDDTAHPWLTPTKALLAAAVAADLPVLGICLGHQLLTVALGGEVRRNPRGQVRGIVAVRLGAGLGGDGTDEVEVRLEPRGEGEGEAREGLGDGADRDPVFGRLPAAAPVLQWNRDAAVVLPAGATLLARDRTDAPHVVRFAPRAWGIQVHPEACVADAREWGAGGEDVVDDLDARTDEILAAWGPAMRAFFALTALTALTASTAVGTPTAPTVTA